MRAVRFEQVKIRARNWRRFLYAAQAADPFVPYKVHKQAEQLAWQTSTKLATELELYGKQYRRYFSYEIRETKHWANMSSMFFVHISNGEWGQAFVVLGSMEDMASRYAAYPYGECPV